MPARPSLLIVEDDAAFAKALGRSFERRGYVVVTHASIEAVREMLVAGPPAFAVVDLKLAGQSGLECVKLLHQCRPPPQIVLCAPSEGETNSNTVRV